jgi:hypothetical protein
MFYPVREQRLDSRNLLQRRPDCNSDSAARLQNPVDLFDHLNEVWKELEPLLAHYQVEFSASIRKDTGVTLPPVYGRIHCASGRNLGTVEIQAKHLSVWLDHWRYWSTPVSQSMRQNRGPAASLPECR